MKRTILCLLILAGMVPAQAVDPTVLRWARGAVAAASLTFDDGSAGWVTNAIPAMEARGIRGTFFIIEGFLPWDDMRAAAAEGHEVGTHLNAHLNNMAVDEVATRLANAKAKLESEVPTQHCVSHAYPFGDDNPAKTVAGRYYVASRDVGSNTSINNDINWATVAGFQQIWGALVGGDRTLDQYKALANQAIAESGWLVELFHAVGETDGGYMTIGAQKFADHLDYLVQRQDELWVAPFGEVARYVRERLAATVTVAGQTATTMTISLTDSLDDTIYTIPLTVTVPLPSGWPWAAVTQKGSPVWSTVRGSEVLFEAVPDGGEILLTSQATSVRSSVPPRVLAPSRRIGVHLVDLAGRRMLGGSERTAVVVAEPRFIVAPTP